jgi:outer membrane biosynthesis protein TonB
MDAKVGEQLLDELMPALEALDTQAAAIVQFVKDKGIATDEQLAPYLEQARNASSVRWRALRLRLARLLSLAERAAEKAPENVQPQKEKKAEEDKEQKTEAEKPEAEKPKAEKAEERTEKKKSVPRETHAESDDSGAAGKKHDDELQEGKPDQKPAEHSRKDAA